MIRVAWNEGYAHPLPEGHRFPMEKYLLVPEQLIHEGTVKSEQFFSPHPLTEREILLAHDAEYWSRLVSGKLTRQEERRSGFPWSPALVQREIMIMGGTVQCARYALQYGVSLNVAGGTHHAYRDRGEGFCLLNDLALAALVLLEEGLIQKALVVDLDVHQGNGTASIFADDARVFTFSMHGASNYPLHKEQSDIDVPLPDGITDEEYLNELDMHWPNLLEKVKPDLVLYQCGVDILNTDKLGRLGLSLEGCRERDRRILEGCYESEIPVVCAMGGGYSEDLWQIVEAHCNTFRIANDLWV